MKKSSLIENYQERGYLMVRDAVPHKTIDQLLEQFLALVKEVSGRVFDDPHSAEIATFLKEHKEIQSTVYNEIRRPNWLVNFSLEAGIVEAVKKLLGSDIALLRKIPFRIDVPLDTIEFAAWHQDHYYVRGNLEIVTVWVPMQDTTYLNGCLAVMPGTHRLGPLEHDKVVLGKRHYPSKVFDREVRYVEIKKGDILLFHSCLLHSSNLNLSNSIRFSAQPRYTRTTEPTDPGMEGIIPIQA